MKNDEVMKQFFLADGFHLVEMYQVYKRVDLGGEEWEVQMTDDYPQPFVCENWNRVRCGTLISARKVVPRLTDAKRLALAVTALKEAKGYNWRSDQVINDVLEEIR